MSDSPMRDQAARGLTAHDLTVRDLTEADFERALVLNESHVPKVNSLTIEQFTSIVQMSHLALGAFLAGHGLAGFTLVVPPGTAYWSDNYRWFSQRYESFIYLDRVAVDESVHGRGVGAALYAEVERRSIGFETWTLEVNLEPENPGSLAFHERMGFRPVGENVTSYGFREQMLAKPLPRRPL